MPLSPGTPLGAYEIIGSLGSGGMGEVYRARDTRLDRDVALKVLPALFAEDTERLARFAREAKALAALNHPHIVTIFSTEEADGMRFLTMELVEGRTLESLVGEGPMQLRQFLDVASALSDAVAAAHARQITHRDLKPANVMLTGDGRVKVLDFGLARIDSEAVWQAETALGVTGAGAILGTMPYMSPEQIEGRALDPKTDVFSLGAILYEMLAGRRPFAGGSAPALMSAILRDTPEPLQRLRADVPPELATLISRCLSKPVGQRPAARELCGELRALKVLASVGGGWVGLPSTTLGPGKADTTEKVDTTSPRTGAAGTTSPGSDSVRRSVSIAVAPFTCSSADDETRTLAEGLRDEAIAGLGRFPYLSLSGPSLNAARYVLEGSVRRAGAAVRVIVHLTDTANGTHLWSDTYTRDLQQQDLFTVQDDLADRVVASVADPHGALMRSIVDGVRHVPPEQLGPRDLVLRYWAYDHQHTPAEHAKLRGALERAVTEHPYEAELWAVSSRLASQEFIFAFDAHPDPLGRARHAAQRAVELDPAGQFGWESLAIASFFSRDREGFVAAAERALAINPRNANTLAWMGSLYAHLGDVDSGERLTRRAMALNPQHPGWYHFTLFMFHAARGEWVDALQATRRINMPAHLFEPMVTAIACVQLGRMEDARAAFERFRAIAPQMAASRELTFAQLECWGWATGSAAANTELLWKAAPGQ